MQTEIESIYQSGAKLYVILHNRITGQIWNNSTLAWETYNSANWTEYAIALTEQTGSGFYTATRPTGVSGYLQSEAIYVQAGSSPALTDAPSIGIQHSQGENIASINSDPAVSPQNLQISLSTEETGTVSTGTISASSFPTSLVNSNVNAYQGKIIRMTSGVAVGMVGLVAQYNPTGGVITLSGSLAATPSAGDSFIIV
jgi:hypothetical protein